MADDGTKVEAEDGSRDGASGHDEVERFARYYDISVEQARHLIDKFGSNKQVLDREAWKQRH